MFLYDIDNVVTEVKTKHFMVHDINNIDTIARRYFYIFISSRQ